MSSQTANTSDAREVNTATPRERNRVRIAEPEVIFVTFAAPVVGSRFAVQSSSQYVQRQRLATLGQAYGGAQAQLLVFAFQSAA